MEDIRETLRAVRREAMQAHERVPANNRASDNLWEIRRLVSDALRDSDDHMEDNDG